MLSGCLQRSECMLQLLPTICAPHLPDNLAWPCLMCGSYAMWLMHADLAAASGWCCIQCKQSSCLLDPRCLHLCNHKHLQHVE